MKIVRWLALPVALALAACGGGGSSSNPTPPPPPASYALSVGITSPVAAGETFTFGLGGQRLDIGAGGAASAFAQPLAEGSSYSVSQLAGPRTCTLSANHVGTVAGQAVAVTADCGTPVAAGAPGGTFYGPVGASVTLRDNGADDLALTIVLAAGTSGAYDRRDFSFATPLPGGSAYAVTLQSAPAGQTCQVFRGAAGTVPAPTAVGVGCEITDDLVSRGNGATETSSYYESATPVIGGAAGPIGRTTQGYGEGRFVAFVSSAAIAGASGRHRQVFWRDRMTGVTQLVSSDAQGAEGNGDSVAPAISADGLTVAFESTAGNLVPGDTNGVSDVFVWSALASVPGVQRASVGAGGVQADGGSFEPTLSGDGRVIAFSSGADNLTPGVSGTSTVNVYRRDLVAGVNTLVSADARGAGVGGLRPALAEDGQRLAFWSYAANLVAGDNNGLWDIFVHDQGSGAITRVSLATGGGERNQGSESASRVVAPAISGDGRWVAYATTASNVVAGDTNNAQDVFVVDTRDGSVVRASVGAGGLQGNGDSPVGQGERVALSYDGRWLAYTTAADNLGVARGNVVLRDLRAGTNQVVTQLTGAFVDAPAISRSGAYVVLGASQPLDLRYPGSGLFAHFTGVARAWWWLDH